jgi:hypothetical protein
MKRLYGILFCFFFQAILAKFPAGTLVKLDQSLCEIERLVLQDYVISYDHQEGCASKPVTNIGIQRLNRCIKFVLEDDVIVMDLNQQLYCVEEGVFKQADKFLIGQNLLDSWGNNCPIWDIVHQDQCADLFFDISVADFHTYFVSRAEILVHNCVPIVAGLSWVFGGGAVEFGGFSIGAIISGIWFGVKARGSGHKRNLSANIHLERDDFMHFNHKKALGKPSGKDGYVPPKKWDGKKLSIRRQTKWGIRIKMETFGSLPGPVPLRMEDHIGMWFIQME